MNQNINHFQIKNAIPIVLLGGFIWLSYAVLRDFFLIISWAFIIAYIMWPAYLRLKAALGGREMLSAAVMTGLISVGISLSLYWLISLLQEEVKAVYQYLVSAYSNPPKQVPSGIEQIPWLGNYLQQFLDRLNSDEAGVKAQFLSWAKQGLGEFGRLLGGLGRNLISLVLVVVTLFFCFRSGSQGIMQIKKALQHFLGASQNDYFRAAGETANAVVYGLVLAALGQGIIAGIGYAVAGVNAPALLAALTALLAMVPMGATLIWVPVSIGLMMADKPLHGTGLFLWGFLVISTIDNVIRPLVISGAGRIPFLVVLFGVLGGLSAFGAVGLFLGPIILSVALAVWKSWIAQLDKADNIKQPD